MSNVFYGRLILLGTNGTATVKELCRTGNGSLELFQRHFPNGVIPGPISFVPDSAQSKVVADPNRHCVSYTFNRTHTVVVEYIPDSNIDLFQVGRYKSPVIDFHIGDLPASSGPASANKDNSPHKNRVLFGMFEKPIFNFGPVPKKPAAPLSTISRFACRIDINRKPPHTARIYAAGFDGRKNIFLGENATKWRHSDIMDGFTTNGVRIFRPSQWLKRAETDNDQSTLWREVSVCGNVYKLHSTMFVPGETDRVEDENNILEDGTLIDLCGAILIWRSADGLKKGLQHTDVCEMVDILNQLHIQCPVYLKTLQFSGSRVPEFSPKYSMVSDNVLANPPLSATFGRGSQPHVYLNCGHVHGYHDWQPNMGQSSNRRDKRTCPLCRQTSRFVRLSIGEEVGFFVDRGPPTHCFNPCGHIASAGTVKFWSELKLPMTSQTAMLPQCPFCSHEVEGPPVRLIFQHRADESTLVEAFASFNCTPTDPSSSQYAPFTFPSVPSSVLIEGKESKTD